MPRSRTDAANVYIIIIIVLDLLFFERLTQWLIKAVWNLVNSLSSLTVFLRLLSAESPTDPRRCPLHGLRRLRGALFERLFKPSMSDTLNPNRNRQTKMLFEKQARTGQLTGALNRHRLKLFLFVQWEYKTVIQTTSVLIEASLLNNYYHNASVRIRCTVC